MTGAQIAERAARRRPFVIPAPSPRDTAKSVAFRALMYAAVGFAMLGLAAILVDIVSDGAGSLSWKFLTEFPTQLQTKITAGNFGVESALVGTIYLMLLTAFFVVPLGIATAVYLEEYADRDRWYNRLVEVNIQNLAAVPSVVYGILGLGFIVRAPLNTGSVLLAGGLTLGLLVLPVVIIVSREALRAVPSSIREGSLALGATQWQTIWKQVLPGSIAGITTGVILALSRAIGETAPLLVIGAAVSPRFNPDPPVDGSFPFVDGVTGTVNSDFTALPIQIFAWTRDVKPELIAAAAGAIVVLMVVLMLMNSFAIFLRNRYEQKW